MCCVKSRNQVNINQICEYVPSKLLVTCCKSFFVVGKGEHLQSRFLETEWRVLLTGASIREDIAVQLLSVFIVKKSRITEI